MFGRFTVKFRVKLRLWPGLGLGLALGLGLTLESASISTFYTFDTRRLEFLLGTVVKTD